MKVATEHQLSKRVRRYHLEVVDASCCDCVDGEPAVNNGAAIVEAPVSSTFYKAAPENAAIGDVIPLSDDDRVKLAVALPSEDNTDSGEPVAVSKN